MGANGMTFRQFAILLGPAVVVSCIALAMLKQQTRGIADPRLQNRRFLLYVAGGGCLAVVLMVAIVGALMLTARGKFTPLWLVFAPWGFALGEAIGFVAWKRRETRLAA
jgi:hypothetical protein